jgi:hypothetical protein
MDRFGQRLKEKNALIQGIKADIKAMLEELGYGDCGGFANFQWTCKPDRFKSVGIDWGSLYFKDNDGSDWHSDNVNDIEELLSILRAMHHILPKG